MSYTARQYASINGSERELWRSECLHKNVGFSKHFLFAQAFDRYGTCNVDTLCALIQKYAPHAIEREFVNANVILRWFHTLGLEPNDLFRVFHAYDTTIQEDVTRRANFWIHATNTFLQCGLCDEIPRLWKHCHLEASDVLAMIKVCSQDYVWAGQSLLSSPFLWGSIFEDDPNGLIPAVATGLSVCERKGKRLFEGLSKMPVAYGYFAHPVLEQLRTLYPDLCIKDASESDMHTLGSIAFARQHENAIRNINEHDYYFCPARFLEYAWLVYGSDTSSIERACLRMSNHVLENPEEPIHVHYNLLAETLIARWSADASQRTPLGSVLSDEHGLGLWAAKILYLYDLEPSRWYRFLSDILGNDIPASVIGMDDMEPLDFITRLAKEIHPTISRAMIEQQLEIAKSLNSENSGIWLSVAFAQIAGTTLSTLEL